MGVRAKKIAFGFLLLLEVFKRAGRREDGMGRLRGCARARAKRDIIARRD